MTWNVCDRPISPPQVLLAETSVVSVCKKASIEKCCRSGSMIQTPRSIPGLRIELSVHVWICRSFSEYAFLCCAMTGFERNLHTQISCGDSFLSITFCGDTFFCSITHYDITIVKDITRDVHYWHILWFHNAYLCCYDPHLLCITMLNYNNFCFLVNPLKFYIKH